ncbi:MAG: hypothetical protein MUE85_11630 [Microscillaceae bacterium]|jgi:hypothetical protein|nr:hypothetical protein [Microscillaceae bacterium]
MDSRKFIIVILLITSYLTTNAQIIKMTRPSQIAFDSIFYFNIENQLLVEMLDKQGNKLPVNDLNLKISLDSGTVVTGSKNEGYSFYVPNIDFTYLSIFWQGKLIQKMKVKILPIPPAKIFLTTQSLNGRAIDVNKPIPCDKILKLVVEPNPHFKTSARFVMCRITQLKLIHKRMNKIIAHNETVNMELDLKQFLTKSGDNIIIELEYFQKMNGRCHAEFTAKEKISFFVR